MSGAPAPGARPGGLAPSPGGAQAVRLADGADQVGLAVMIADLVRQSLEQKPGKWKDFNGLSSLVAIDVPDAGVTVSLEFLEGSLVVHAGTPGDPDIRITAPAESVLALCMVKIVGGVPHPLHHHNRAVVARILRGEVRIEGLARSPLQLLRLTRLLSVRE